MATYVASVRKALADSQQDLIDHKEHCSADPCEARRRSGVRLDIRSGSSATTRSTRCTRSARSARRARTPSSGWAKAAGSGSAPPTSSTPRSIRRCRIPPSATPRPRPTASSSSGSRMTARIRDSSSLHPTGETSSASPTSRPSASRPDSPPGQSARGDARAGSEAAAPSIAGTSPRPTFTRRVSRASTRSSSGASPMRSRSMAPTPPRSSSGARRPALSRRRSRRRSTRAIAGSGITVRIASADEGVGGDSPRNIVNRLTANGANGIQIEQSLARPHEPLAGHRRRGAEGLRRQARISAPGPRPIGSASQHVRPPERSLRRRRGRDQRWSSMQPARPASIGGHACRCSSSRRGQDGRRRERSTAPYASPSRAARSSSRWSFALRPIPRRGASVLAYRPGGDVDGG